jgi:hypothetical protein
LPIFWAWEEAPRPLMRRRGGFSGGVLPKTHAE